MSDHQYWKVKSCIYLQKGATTDRISSKFPHMDVSQRWPEGAGRKQLIFHARSSPCPFHWCCHWTPSYSSTNCFGGLCDVDTDSFVDIKCRAPRSHQI